MTPLFVTTQGILPVSVVGLMGDEFRRDELIRIRLSADDLARVTAIQDYLKRSAAQSSFGKVVSNAIGCYYEVLVAEGSVPPNL
jgi:hypothetical protein